MIDLPKIIRRETTNTGQSITVRCWCGCEVSCREDHNICALCGVGFNKKGMPKMTLFFVQHRWPDGAIDATVSEDFDGALLSVADMGHVHQTTARVFQVDLDVETGTFETAKEITSDICDALFAEFEKSWWEYPETNINPLIEDRAREYYDEGKANGELQ